MIRLLGVALGALALAVFCSVQLNPEVRFWSELFEIKDREISEIEGPKIIFTGGSSCTFSVSPPIVSESLGRESYNFGGSAMMGPRYIFERVKKHVNKGDTLVIGFEPEILKGLDGTKRYPLGRRMAIYERDLKTAKAIGTEKNNSSEWVSVMRPGLRNMVVMTGRKLKGGKAYAYSMDDRKDLGRLELRKVEFQRPATQTVAKIVIDPTAANFLKEIVHFCEERGAECFYTLPWLAVDTGIVDEVRNVRRVYMEEMAKIMPVLPDERYGVIEGIGGFSDSEYHMGAELSAERSLFLATKLAPLLDQQ